MALIKWVSSPKFSPFPYIPTFISRSFSLWSMKKDAALESALSRNRRWIVNNQLKNIILRCPNQIAPVRFLQKKFKTLDLQGKALNWLRKYPCCFEVFLENDENYCQLTKRMIALVEEEESIREQQEQVMVVKLAKLLMMSCNRRLNVVKFNELRRNFGLPDDYLVRILPKYPEIFQIVNRGGGKRSTMEIELLSWDPKLAVSAIEASACEKNIDPGFEFCLPLSWIKSRERFLEFNENVPYISPYSEVGGLEDGSKEMEKMVVGLVHELLSLTLWKKASIIKLGHFRREFRLPEKLNALLLGHPGIFYVSNKYQIHTVVLREGYCGSELINKDSLVVVKEKFGELMQEGLHEYNRRRHAVNLEKKRKRGVVGVRSEREERRSIGVMSDPDDNGGPQKDAYSLEERRRFYKALFDDNAP
eukprot:TRINITY_DN6895_c0_g1_i2.p1 TRINITY_DN6895_c0_g1~~TRINITY_DN6895_c0_g1_i2.p1  ORF type:complete len:419 (+),score=78.76 TRINITY_DN6895_c0_g1_i2:429-1685(+)